MKILFVGEIVAEPGRQVVKSVLPGLIKEHKVDLVLSNAENLAGGRGITEETIEEMKLAGIDYFTGGDHTFWQKGTDDLIDNLPVLRPANYPSDVPGKGHVLIDSGKHGNVLLVNLMGRTSFNSINSYLDDPFTKADQILEEYKGQKLAAIIVDFHGDSTSEKSAFGFYVDGRVDAVIGSHTHVPTCDGMFLPGGTAFLTVVGMTGIVDSVLGVKKEIVIEMFKSARNQRFDWESTGRKAFRSVLLDTKEKVIFRIDKEI